jgi:adenosylcobinamide-phosphate synthase
MTPVLVLTSALLVEVRLRLPNSLHPVAWLGKLAQALIDRAPLAPRWPALLAGAAIALFVPAFVYGLAHAAFAALHRFPLAEAGAQALALYTSVCLFTLLDAARDLRRTLECGEITAARPKLAALCSRGADGLGARELSNGAIASLAENLTDAVVAPLLALVLFGVEGALAYRAVNTLDAMIGYRGRFESLGKGAARLDDLVNFVPGRLSALFLFAAAALLPGTSLSRGARVWWRDRNRTPSPNGGQAMAMAAGLLGVRLDKPPCYVLGEDLDEPRPSDISRAVALVRCAGLLAWACALLGAAEAGLGGIWRLHG